jgi:hypothetical protein
MDKPISFRNLSVLNYAQGFTMWLYRDRQLTIAELRAPGFFDSMIEMIRDGDVIMLSGINGSSMMTMRLFSNIVSLEAMQ